MTILVFLALVAFLLWVVLAQYEAYGVIKHPNEGSTDRFVDMAVRWRESTPVEIMSTEAILLETLRILRAERAQELLSIQSGMPVEKDRVYGVDNQTFSNRENWE